ncbi:MAG: hypothetical protein R3F29_08275 [Planctomycetota bacterium]
MIPVVFAYLVLGHALGDAAVRRFPLPQPRPSLLRMLVHALALLPVWVATPSGDRAAPLLLMVLALGGTHWLCDIGAAWLEKHCSALAALLTEQAARFAMLFCAAWLASGEVRPGGTGAARFAVIAAAYLLVTSTGSEVVKRLLARHAMPAAEPDAAPPGPTARMGHTIGVLERALGLTFILIDAWTGLAGIVAAKSIARFKDLEQRAFAEYFLVGTLASLLVTTAVGAAASWLLDTLP